VTVERADAVVVGGGILGCAAAWYLSAFLPGKVVLAERGEIASGNSCRAAGLVTAVRPVETLVPLVRETLRVVEELEEVLDESLGVRKVGHLHAATGTEGAKELAGLLASARNRGDRASLLPPGEVRELVPWLRIGENAFAALFPDEAVADGAVLAGAFARGARLHGAAIRPRTAVRAILRQGDRIAGVYTAEGRISSPVVIDAAGAWAALLAGEAGVNLPTAPVRSSYWITARHDRFRRTGPAVILPEARGYARPESGALLFGVREEVSRVADPRLLPDALDGWSLTTEEESWDLLAAAAPELSSFFPALEETGIARFVEGLSTYTPDGMLVLGETPGVRGLFALTGCSGAGISVAGGAGRLVAELAAGRAPFTDPAPHRPDRFGAAGDPFDESFRRRCGEARSRKTSG